MTKLELTQSARRSLWRFMTLVRDLKSATDAVSSQNDQLLPSWREMPFCTETPRPTSRPRVDHSVMKRQRLRLADSVSSSLVGGRLPPRLEALQRPLTATMRMDREAGPSCGR